MKVTLEQRSYARLAGVMILLNYVLQDLGDRVTLRRAPETFAETARWASHADVLYRVSLVEVAAAWIVIGVLALALYAVLEPVNKRLAQLALVLRLGASFVGAASVMFRMAQARLYQASTPEGLFTTEQLRALVAVSQRGAGAGVTVAWMFMAAGSVLFFVLFMRSRYLPRALAGFSIVASALMFAVAVAMFVFPARTNELKLFGAPMFVAEVATALWLLIRGLGPRISGESPA